jgi:hypothetical protein
MFTEKDFETDIFSNETKIETYLLFDGEVINSLQQVKNHKVLVIDKIEEYERKMFEQKKLIEDLRERNSNLKYNLSQKEKIKKHVANVYSLCFENTHFPIVIHGENDTILSCNRAAAVSFLYFEF